MAWLKTRDRLNVLLIGAIGAVFDFYAGTKSVRRTGCAVDRDVAVVPYRVGDRYARHSPSTFPRHHPRARKYSTGDFPVHYGITGYNCRNHIAGVVTG